MSLTDKYEFEEIDYSTTGWNAVITANLQLLDELLHTYLMGTAGQTLVAGEAVYLYSDGKYRKAKADAVTTMPALGLVVQAADVDQSVLVQRVGPVTNTGWSWTVGGAVYLSDATAGALTQTQPTTYSQMIGVAITATSLVLFINRPTSALSDLASQNVGIGIKTFGTNAAKCFGMASGTAPTTSPADAAQMYVYDQAAGVACFHTRDEAGGVVKLYQRANAAQATISAPAAFGNANGEIGGLSFANLLVAVGVSAHAEVTALRDKCEELADDCRALRDTVAAYETLLSEIRTTLVNNGLIKGSA